MVRDHAKGIYCENLDKLDMLLLTLVSKFLMGFHKFGTNDNFCLRHYCQPRCAKINNHNRDNIWDNPIHILVAFVKDNLLFTNTVMKKENTLRGISVTRVCDTYNAYQPLLG